MSHIRTPRLGQMTFPRSPPLEFEARSTHFLHCDAAFSPLKGKTGINEQGLPGNIPSTLCWFLLMITVSTIVISLFPTFKNTLRACLDFVLTLRVQLILEWDAMMSFYLLSFIFDGLYNGNKNIISMASDYTTLTLFCLIFPCK